MNYNNFNKHFSITIKYLFSETSHHNRIDIDEIRFYTIHMSYVTGFLHTYNSSQTLVAATAIKLCPWWDINLSSLDSTCGLTCHVVFMLVSNMIFISAVNCNKQYVKQPINSNSWLPAPNTNNLQKNHNII